MTATDQAINQTLLRGRPKPHEPHETQTLHPLLCVSTVKAGHQNSATHMGIKQVREGFIKCFYWFIILFYLKLLLQCFYLYNKTALHAHRCT